MRYAAERRHLDESIEELRQIADGRNDILAEATGIAAGSWYASPTGRVGYELIGEETVDGVVVDGFQRDHRGG